MFYDQRDQENVVLATYLLSFVLESPWSFRLNAEKTAIML